MYLIVTENLLGNWPVCGHLATTNRCTFGSPPSRPEQVTRVKTIDTTKRTVIEQWLKMINHGNVVIISHRTF